MNQKEVDYHMAQVFKRAMWRKYMMGDTADLRDIILELVREMPIERIN